MAAINFSGCLFTQYDYYNADKAVQIRVSEAIQKKDPSLCSQLPLEVQKPYDPHTEPEGEVFYKHPRDKCFLEYVEVVPNIDICNLVSNNLKDYCLLKYAQATADMKICDLMTYKNSCLQYMAEIYSNPDLCSQLTGPSSWKDSVICRAVAKLDVNICLEFESEEYAHLDYSPATDCIEEVVKRTKDWNSCLLIKEGGYMTDGPDAWKGNTNHCLYLARCKYPKLKDSKFICDAILEYDDSSDGREACYKEDELYCPDIPKRVQ